MKKGITLAGLAILLILNFITVGTSVILPDVFIIMFALGCFGVVFIYARKDKEYSSLWIMLSFIPLFWALNRIYSLIDIVYLPAKELPLRFSSVLMIIPEIMMLIIILLFMIKRFRKIYWTKFILDAITLVIIILGIASGVVFSHLSTSEIVGFDFTLLVLNVLVDLIIVVTLLLLLTSISRKHVDKTLYMISASFAFYIYSDFDKMYERIAVDYQVANFSHYLYYVAFILMAIGAMKSNSMMTDYLEQMEQKPDNLTNTRVVLYVMVLPIYLYIIGELSIAHLAAISIVVIIYQYINIFMQRAFLAEKDLLERERVMRELEMLVGERTKELTETNTKLYIKSTTDALTGIYNRPFLLESCREAIENKKSVLLIQISIEKFWVINSYHGHEFGDSILIEIAKRLKTLERNGVITARIGGSKFAVLMPMDEEYMTETDKILDMIKNPINVNDFAFQLEISVGIARYPDDAQTEGELLRDAELAMNYVRHQMSDNKVALYSNQMIQKIDRLNHLELLLRDADYQNDFELHYQPKFDVEKGELIGMEALLRWKHPKEGFISPSEFIPVAEETGLIIEISHWVFREAMEQISEWNTEYNTSLKMSMNVSPISLDRIDFVDGIQELMKETNVKAEWLELEITEYMAVSSDNKSDETFARLRNMGISISIDDFGTGYSSLSYMVNYQVDVLKIARELVMNIVECPNEKLIVEAIVTMAKGMGLALIAEGVELDEQMEVLQSLGCQHVQGYLTGRPVDPNMFEELYLSKEYKV